MVASKLCEKWILVAIVTLDKVATIELMHLSLTELPVDLSLPVM